MRGKRVLDLLVTVPGLILLSPLLVVIAIAIRLDSPGPALFRQQRLGRGERIFDLLKFRSMVHQPEAPGVPLTAAGDIRITRVGRVLRRSKLDELPQLFNVLVGSMSLVGPRPEVPKYVALYPQALKRKILSVRPGITDDAALEFINEEQLLAREPDPERTYIDTILPRKLELYVDYVDGWSLKRDIGLILATLWLVIAGRRRTRGEHHVEA